MGNNIQLFNFKGSQVRIFMSDNGDPEFCANDITGILGYQNGRDAIAKHCKSNGVAKRDMVVERIKKADGTPEMQTVSATFINESNLYRLILKSDKPEADLFNDWVTEEILPSIRKHGMYATPDTLENLVANPDLLIKLANRIKQETAAREAVERQLQIQVKIIEEQEPKIEFLDKIMDAPGTISISQFAKLLNSQYGIDIGRNKLYDWFRERKFLCSQRSEYNKPYQTEIENGCMKFTTQPITIKKKSVDIEQINYCPLITKKGELKYAPRIVRDFAPKSGKTDTQTELF